MTTGERVTRDGCPVELYRRLPYRGEVEAFAAHVPPGASILELGCGAGRMTGPMIDAGYEVTAVDNSHAMLESVPATAHRVLADIEALRLGRTFDVVLLASCLINVADEVDCAACLATCREHMDARSLLIFQRNDPAWLAGANVGFIGTIGTIAMHLERVSRDGDVAEMCVRYDQGAESWRHRFRSRALDDAAVDRRLAASGLGAARWLDERRLWGASRRGGFDAGAPPQ